MERKRDSDPRPSAWEGEERVPHRAVPSRNQLKTLHQANPRSRTWRTRPQQVARSLVPPLVPTSSERSAAALRRPKLTVHDVAARLRVSTATVYSLCRRGELEHHRISHAIRVPETAVAKYLTSGHTPASANAGPGRGA